jgi:predicted Fe-Mo cluster-binding NifX family protein
VNICIPVNEDKGLQSPLCEHFGSAPLFLIVDTESGACRPVSNRNQHHAHGMCQPLSSLAGEQLDGIVVGGIGKGALARLQAANVQVFLSAHASVAETLEAYKAGTLRPMTAQIACGGHAHGRHGCGDGGQRRRQRGGATQ